MIRLLVNFLEFMINHFYQNRWYPRFYVLETVARVPYFSYISVLHLYESLGCWRKADWLKVHFAESWNELHHLLIMESLGGDRYWIDRFIAHHAALVYYWVIVLLYLIRPKSAYYFAELVERHAYHTYDTFLKEHGDELKAKIAPPIAVNYYRDGDLYMFDEFQTSRLPTERRPIIKTLRDVFVAIRDDEAEHIKTMTACQEPNAQFVLTSPHSKVIQSAIALPSRKLNQEPIS
ncbi:MAG: alternative oxidase [Xenococcaceae cyanobacterium MO_207.B15]|nr:alternative oxidase [Xenococcaceae cyanobacterium MO_207.B15]